MLKRRIAIIMTALLVCSMTACSQAQNSSSSAENTNTSVSEKIIVNDSNDTSTELNAESQTEDSSESSKSDSSGENKTKSAKQTSTDTEDNDIQKEEEKTVQTESSTSEKSETKTTVASGVLSSQDVFSDRDLTQTADTSSAQSITVSDGQTISITEEGVYVIKGTASNCTIRIEADKEAKVQIVLDGVSITNDSTPAIYVVSADKCFITSTGSNSLSVTGSFSADGDTNTDAVIFSKDDIVLNGTGSLTINSAQGNGISGKDDVKITGGTYDITSAEDGIEAHDSIRIGGGTITIKAGKDGLHCEDDEDDTVGWIYISDGTLDITSSSDGIRGTTYTQIDGGTINVSSVEGIESTYIQINGGNVDVSTTDDGINASQKSKSIGTPVFEITGGSLTVTMSGNDVDCIDSNGNIIVSGGTINVSYPTQGPSESFDCDGTATYTGGTIIINGSQVDSIPQSMMGGRGMMGNMGRGRMM